MFQLKFSDDYKDIIEDIPYWKTPENIPSGIKDSLSQMSDNIVVFDKATGKYCCGKCLQPLEDNFYCCKCNIQHNDCKNYLSKFKDDNFKSYYLRNLRDFKIVDSIKYDYSYFPHKYYSCEYYVFDVIYNKVFLYLLNEEVSYSTFSLDEVHKSNSFSIFKTYLISKDGITDISIINQVKYYSFSENSYAIDGCFFEEEEFDSDNFEKYDNILSYFTHIEPAYLYLDNLKQLRNTVYKYSFLWENGSYLNKSGHGISLNSLTYLPIYYSKQFEYLLKFHLYNLAFFSANEFKSGKNFESIFGVNKKYLPFMVENDITYSQLCVLQIYPKEDINIIGSLIDYSYILKELKNNFNVNIDKLLSYFHNNSISYDSFFEYRDYLDMARKQGFDLKDNNVRFPNNLMEEHNKLYIQMKIIDDPDIDNRIRNLSNLFDFNYYEDSKYIIFPADSIKSLIDESEQQKNCVRTYCDMVANNECQIYFLREKNNQTRSLVTIEVRNAKVVQARAKFNEQPSEEIQRIINKWEKTLLSILSDDEELDDY